MFLGLFNNKHFIPMQYVKSVFEIDYTKLYESGVRLILTDLDNTLISYKESEPKIEQYHWLKDVKELGFEVIIVSNNSSKERVSHFAELFDVPYVNFAMKPTKLGFKKALKKAKKTYRTDEIIALGDQLMTDVLAANRMGFKTFLIQAVDKKSDILPTRINRRLERHVLKVLSKKEPLLYKQKLLAYKEENHGNS